MPSIRNLTVSYGRHTVLESVDVDFRPGVITGLIGANGAGKSSLIKAALGLLPHPGARIDFPDSIGYMPQHAAIDWDFPATLADVALMGRTCHRSWWQWPTGADKAVAAAALEQVGLAGKANDPISALSGGQRQRTLLARALATQPEVLVLDEPFAGVDQRSQDTIVEVLRGVEGVTIIVVHHNLSEVAQFCDDVVLLGHAGVIAAGPVETTLSDAAIARLYSLPHA